MLLDVTLHLLHSGPCGLAGGFQPKDCHRRGGYSMNMTLSHHCLVLPWSLSMDAAVIPVGAGGTSLGLGFHCSRAPRAAHLQDLVYFGISEQHRAVPPPPHWGQVGAG